MSLRRPLNLDGWALTLAYLGLCLVQAMINGHERPGIVVGAEFHPDNRALYVLLAGLVLRLWWCWLLLLILEVAATLTATLTAAGVTNGINQLGPAVIRPTGTTGSLVATVVCSGLSVVVLLAPQMRQRQVGIGVLWGVMRDWIRG